MPAPISLRMPDGRSLDAEIRAVEERGLRIVSWSRPGYGDSTRQSGRRVAHMPGAACPHLLPEHGHLSLAVDGFPMILDELIHPAD